jgi:RecG-like helicase
MEVDMSVLAKLNLKTVQRTVVKDPVTLRREKLIAGIEEQLRVVEAAMRGDSYKVRTTKRVNNDAGVRVAVENERTVRAWFFEQDRGYYVQCRYGARILMLNGKNNAVWVETLKDVADVLAAFKAAVLAGELDKAVAMAMARANG